MDGEELHVVLDTSYAIPRPFILRPSTRIKDVFFACCETLKWPHEFMSLIIDGNTYKWPRLHSEQKHLDSLVTNIIPSTIGSQQLSDVVFAYYRWVPKNFQAADAQGYCLCNFGGCCRLCNVPSGQICWGCGNNGGCRSESCGHSCCKLPRSIDPERRCPLMGCRPEWADDF